MEAEKQTSQPLQRTYTTIKQSMNARVDP